MNDCMANVSLFIIRTAYGPEAEKINLLAGLLQEAGLQGEIKVACGVEALGCLFGLKHYQSVISGFSYHSGADRNISLYNPKNEKTVLEKRKRKVRPGRRKNENGKFSDTHTKKRQRLNVNKTVFKRCFFM